MKVNQKHIPIGDLKAETWLNGHFPDLSPIRVGTKGIFQSNYCEDLLEVETFDNLTNRVTLSRDGILQLLPEGLFVEENRLLDPKKNPKPFEEVKGQIKDFFVPFDTEYFRVTLGLDRRIQETETGLVDLLVGFLYDLDIQNIQNPMIRKAAPFLLQASEIRGDYVLIGRIATAISGFRTEIQPVSRVLNSSLGGSWEQQVARIVFHIPDLSNSEYATRYSHIGEFADFLADWFLPADQPYEYAIKEEGRAFVLDGSLTLDYNTYL